jgi:hypothetical protein
MAPDGRGSVLRATTATTWRSIGDIPAHRAGEDLLADRGERALEGDRELGTRDPPVDRRIEGEVAKLLQVVGSPAGELDDLRDDLGVESDHRFLHGFDDRPSRINGIEGSDR